MCRRDCCREGFAAQNFTSDLHLAVQARSGNGVHLLANQTSALHVAVRGQLFYDQLTLRRPGSTQSLMLTYSTIVFCNSGGKAKIAGSSEALDSAAAAPTEGGWTMVSRLGEVVAPPAPD